MKRSHMQMMKRSQSSSVVVHLYHRCYLALPMDIFFQDKIKMKRPDIMIIGIIITGC